MTARGMTYEQIAKSKFVAVSTVRAAFTKARERKGASTTAQCIVLAIAHEELGLTHDGVCFVPEEPQ